jgi:hypothetical protein
VRDILIKEYGLIFPNSNGKKKNTHIQVSWQSETDCPYLHRFLYILSSSS